MKQPDTLHKLRIKNVRSIGSNSEGLNSKVKRLNGIIIDRETVIRAMDNAESAQR